MTREEEILNFMKSLSISREEAEELYESDHSDEILPEVEEMEKKAKQIKRYEKSNKKRKPSSRVRKVDNTEKKFLLHILNCALADVDIQATPHNETELSFKFNSTNFTIKLIRHREPKSQK